MSLRRADWRFLLPTPAGESFDHLLLCGGPPGLAEQLLGAGMARRVSASPSIGDSADAVAVLAGATVSWDRAIGALRRGGSLYLELDRHLPTSLISARRRRLALARLGLVVVGAYWAKPNFERCEMYLPLDVNDTLGWFMTHVYTASTPARLLLEAGVRLATGLRSSRFAWVAPYLALTAVRPPADLFPLGLNRLPEHFRQSDLVPLILTDAGERAVVLPFRRGSAEPVMVIKIPKLPGASERTEREQQVLVDVRSEVSASVRRAIPEPLGVVRRHGVVASMEGYMSGTSLLRSSGRWNVSMASKLRDLNDAAEWIAEFHRQTTHTREPWSSAAIARFVDAPFSEYGRRFGESAAEQRLFIASKRRATRLIGTAFPTVWQHNDFSIANVLRHGNELRVIDWEGGRRGPPACDLLYFATLWAYAVERASTPGAQHRTFQRMFLARAGDPVATAVRSAVDRYLATVQLDRRFIPLLLTCSWVELAIGRARRQRTLGESDARDGNRAVAYVGILGEYVHRLYAERTEGSLDTLRQ